MQNFITFKKLALIKANIITFFHIFTLKWYNLQFV